MAWVESNCPSDCGIVWGDDGYCNRPPKQSHNRLGSYSRPRPSLFFKVGYSYLHLVKTLVYDTRCLHFIFLISFPRSICFIFSYIPSLLYHPYLPFLILALWRMNLVNDVTRHVSHSSSVVWVFCHGFDSSRWLELFLPSTLVTWCS